MEKPVALGADHGGFALKEAVRAHLDERGVPYVDYGTHSEASAAYTVGFWPSSPVHIYPFTYPKAVTSKSC